MGCKQVKIQPAITPSEQVNRNEGVNHNDIDLSPIDHEAFTLKVCQKRQSAIDNMFLRNKIDKWQPISIEQLANLIEELAANRSRIDLAWIIFYWISQNIRYDTNAHLSDRIGEQTAKNVFETGKTTSEGYSELYAELCDRTGLSCRKINGYAKGHNFDSRQTSFTKRNHTWNVLSLNDGQLYFVDPTWGSGHLNVITLQYEAQLMPRFFLCRPEHMIYEHFPENEPWQLLAHPLTIEQFLMLPLVHDAFFDCNLRIISPRNSHVVNIKPDESYGEVLIRSPDDNTIELCGSLEDDSDKKVEGGADVYYDKNKKVWICRFAPQKAGKHTILISARKKNSARTNFSAAIEYVFDINHFTFPPVSYPIKWPYFSDYNLEMIKPINRYYIDIPLDNNVPYSEILVRSPNDVRISAKIADSSTGINADNGSLINFDSQRSLWQCLFVPTAADVTYQLTLFAQRPDDIRSQRVAQLELQKVNSSVLQKCLPFPETSEIFQQAKCHLFEPLNGILKRGSIIIFQCQILGAREVKFTIDGNWLDGNASKLDQDDVFRHEIRVGQKEVIVWAKFNDSESKYQGLLKYTVK